MIISHDRFGRKISPKLSDGTNVFTFQSTRGLESRPKCKRCINSGYGYYMVWNKRKREWYCPSCRGHFAKFYNHYKMEK